MYNKDHSTLMEARMKKFHKLVLTLMTALLFAAATFNTQAFAQKEKDPPAAEVMAVDLLVLKPLGFVTTVLGCVLYTVSLPLTMWSKERMNKTAERFIIEPATYTFVRPLGEGLTQTP